MKCKGFRGFGKEQLHKESTTKDHNTKNKNKIYEVSKSTGH